MSIPRRFSLQLVALAVSALGLIWMAGSGVAVQTSSAESDIIYQELQRELADLNPIIIADTVNIKANDEIDGLSSPHELPDTRETLFKNIKLFNNMAYRVKNSYMEDIDSKDLIKAGIRGMLSDLDPFSVLLEEKSYDRLMESTHGSYEGVGMQIDNRDDYIRVITPIEGTPAYRLGLQAGDVIREIDGTSTYKMNTQDAADLMRGPAGTEVTLKIKRTGVPDMMEYVIERAVIELKSVNYYGFIDDSNIGYLRLNRFAEETGNELREAVLDMQSQKKMDGMIFDLRSNGGGLLTQAIETANLFLGPEKLIVYTRGRTQSSERRYYSENEALFPKGKLVILVDGGTASASEIVSGAIQDWDRGIIMGENTYGKGLVQQIFPAGGDYGIALKLTTAKYYIPSGRCIQRPENNTKNRIPDHATKDDDEVADSLNIEEKEVFFTDGGRTVYGGGGIVPDIESERDNYENIEINLERKSMFFDFCVQYSSDHPEIDESFEVTDEIIAQFKAYLVEREFDYKTALEVSLDKMKEIVEDESKQDIFDQSLEQLATMVDHEKEADFEKSDKYIRRAIKRELMVKLYGQTGMYEQIVLKTDPVVREAYELIKNDKEYTRLIEGGEDKAEL